MSDAKKSLFKRGLDKKPVLAEVKEVVLDEHQMNAVMSRNSNTLVVAGAGSGKTAVLTKRVEHLIKDEGVKPSNIIAITFTNMASEEMKERLSNVDGIGDAFIGTIHSFANRVMKLSGEVYRIYDDAIENDFMGELINKYAKFLTRERFLEWKDLKSKEMMGQVSEYEVNNFLEPSEQCEYHLFTRGEHEEVAGLDLYGIAFADYPETIGSLCKARKVITFDELLKKAEKYFRSIDAHIEHVLVDEFQDVGTLEFQFIEALQADNYFLVGDDWQSIYGFKGGNVEIFKKLVTDGLFSVYYLNNNYRNGRQILNVAETVINQVYSKIDKAIVQMCDEEGEVLIDTKKNVDKYLRAIKESGEFRSTFVLTRSNKDLYELAERLEDAEIPYTTFKREGMGLAEIREKMAENKVKLLTVHVSKGLEADNVLMYGNFPIMCPKYRNNEEERKVMYVGITRARKSLCILN